MVRVNKIVFSNQNLNSGSLRMKGLNSSLDFVGSSPASSASEIIKT